MSLIARAAPSGSPPNVGSSWTLPFLQMTGLICKTWGSPVIEGSQVGSGAAISACPATSPLLLTPVAWPLLPPNVGSGVITPFCQRNGRHIRGVPKPQKSSPNGSGVEVSALPPTLSPGRVERPSTEPLLLMPAASLNVPPSVPRSNRPYGSNRSHGCDGCRSDRVRGSFFPLTRHSITRLRLFLRSTLKLFLDLQPPEALC